MKKFFINLMAALFAVAIVSCDKDSSDDENEEGGETISNSDNSAKVGDVTSSLSCDLMFDDFGEANFSARGMEAGKRIHFSAGIAWESIGKTINLATPQASEEYWFRYEEFLEQEEGLQFTQRNDLGNVYSDYKHEEGTDEPIFASGTLTTKQIEGGYTLVIDGTLKSGIAVLIKLNVPFTEKIVPLSRNTLIYDGVKYELTSSAKQNPSNAIIHWTGNNESANISSSGDIYPSSDNLHADLPDQPSGDGYQFAFNVSLPELQLSYFWNNDHLECQLDGKSVANPFVDGYAEIGAYRGQMSFIAIGTLTNGKVLKLRVSTYY
ncbi:MAG: hypothetical protein J6Y37_03605 [Paludibacteraceae bacterium]|nr:hypothetical protein [Paludibacteraceae bacterium]MBR4839220.1 hypothetical protein [Paludibacteraceae bacterium]